MSPRGTEESEAPRPRQGPPAESRGGDRSRPTVPGSRAPTAGGGGCVRGPRTDAREEGSEPVRPPGRQVGDGSAPFLTERQEAKAGGPQARRTVHVWAGDGRRGRQPPPGAEGRTASPRQRVGCREPCGAQEHWAQGHGDQVQTCALPPWPSPTCCTPARAALRPSLPVLDSATPRVPPPVATGTQGGKVWPGQADPRGLVLGVTHPVASTLAGGGGPNGAGPASPTESPEGVPGSARPGTRTSPPGWPRSPSARTLALSPDGPGVHSGIAGASDVAPAITRHLLSGQTFPNGDAARATALRRP